MKIISSAFAILIFLVGCRKDGPLYDGLCTGDCTTFKGQLIEKQTGSGLNDVLLRFYLKSAPSPFGNGHTDLLGTTTTNSTGLYHFSVPSHVTKSAGSIIIATTKAGYVNRTVNTSDHLVNIQLQNPVDSVIINDLELWKSSPLRVRVVTVNNIGFDQFYFTHLFSSAINYNNQVNGRRFFDTTFVTETASDVPAYINWRTGNKFGNTGSLILSGTDTITVPFGTTGNILIEL